MEVEFRDCPGCGSPSLNPQLHCELCGVDCRWAPDGRNLICIAARLVCPVCVSSNPVGEVNCGNCGAPLLFVCPVCDGEHPVGTRFCPERSGQSIEEALQAIEAARKVEEAARNEKRRTAIDNMRFLQVPAGKFVMGSPARGFFTDGEEGRSDTEVQHEVTLTRPFVLGETAVCQAEYEALIGRNYSRFGNLDHPVENVSWFDAVGFCNALSRKMGFEEAYLVDGEEVTWKGLDCPGYRLPTEAEWEYACRAGTTGARYGYLDAIAWYEDKSDGHTRPVRRGAPNAWGFYDMLGNVWEWCWDWHGDYPHRPLTDPVGPDHGDRRVGRGGSFRYGASYARAAKRRRWFPNLRYDDLGFRVARTLT